jgi:hypothetical protein
VRLRLRLNSIEEAERWVLSWGTHATVVRPQALAARLCHTAIDLQDRYKALRQQPDEPVLKRGRVAPGPTSLSFFAKGTRSASVVREQR